MPEGHLGPIDRSGNRKPHWKAGEKPLTGPLVQFYRTTALPCPYLPGRAERKLVSDISGRDAAALYNELCRAGFRRSHFLAYRPACADCQACVPVRIDAAGFTMRHSRRRIMAANADLVGRDTGPRISVEQYNLFQRYQHARHADSDMAGMSFGDYRAMVEQSGIDTTLFEFRDGNGRLWGACLADCLDDGFSAVYSFFEPDAPARSLGSYIIQWLVERAKTLGLPYVYLGYWIEASAKMAYKRRFHPLEGLVDGRWQLLPP